MYGLNLFFLVFFLSISSVSAQPRCCDNNYNAGKKAFESQNYDEAIRFYTQGSRCGDKCKYDFEKLIREVRTKQKELVAPISSIKTVATPAKFNAGNSTGDFIALCGAFASMDNALSLVEKLKKLGYENAEVVKYKNSDSYYVVAGYFEFKGSADAAVRTLKANKIESYVKKRGSEVYKPAYVAKPS